MSTHEDIYDRVIRRGEVTDAAELAAFAARTFEETFASDNNPEDLRVHLSNNYGEQQQAKELADPNVVTLLVRQNDEIVAYAQVRRCSAPDCVTQADPVELHRFYVDRPAHGTGLAARLMQEAVNVVRELGGQHIWLGVWERNPRAIAFYSKSGFVDVGSQYYMVGPDRQVDRVLVAPV